MRDKIDAEKAIDLIQTHELIHRLSTTDYVGLNRSRAMAFVGGLHYAAEIIAEMRKEASND